MKKLFYSAVLYFFCFSFFGQIVNIPDAAFKNKLVTSTTSNGVALDSFGNSIKIDANNNGEIEINEIQNITTINMAPLSVINPGGIVSMEGIENFINLKKLRCAGNHISNLDLSGLSLLEEVKCGHNLITNLNVTGLSKLKVLECEENNINNIDTNGLNNLETLYVFNNTISNLNLNSLTNLVTLWCSNNQLTNLDLTVLSNIKYVYCDGNQIADLNVKNVTSLIELTCYGNQLASLNLVGLNNLKYLNFSNNLIPNIDLSPLTSIGDLDCGYNPISSINLNGLNTLKNLYIPGTLISTLDCSQSGVVQLICSNNPNLIYINVKNNHYTSSDPDLLFFGFIFEDLPLLTSICLDSGEVGNLNFTNFNSSGKVILYTGANCSTVIELPNMGINAVEFNNYFSLFPNPAKNLLHLEVKTAVSVQSINIYNTLGQLAQTFPEENFGMEKVMDVAQLKSGVYYLEVYSNLGKTTKRFVKL